MSKKQNMFTDQNEFWLLDDLLHALNDWREASSFFSSYPIMDDKYIIYLLS